MRIQIKRYLVSVASVLLLIGGPVFAQTETIKIVLGASPGGSTDLIARAIAKGMTEHLRQPVVVENKAGAAGNIAAEYVARSNPDGNTLLVSYTSFSANKSLYKNLSYDPISDFKGISMLGTVPSVLITTPDFPANNTAELIELVRKNPGKYTAGLGGIASSLHFATEVLKLKAALDIVNVPYKGAGPAMMDLLGGHIDMMFASTLTTIPLMKEGTIKVLGVTSTTPLDEFPGAAPIADSIKGFESISWYGLFGPAKMSDEKVDQLNEAVRVATSSPEFIRLMQSQAGKAESSTPGELAQFLQSNIDHYAEVVQATGMSMDE